MKRIKEAIHTDNKIKEMKLHPGIDTIQIRALDGGEWTAEQYPFAHTKISRQSDSAYSHYILNPNTAQGEYIQTFSTYKTAKAYMLDVFPVNDPSISRIDFRFDLFDQVFDQWYKLNCLFLLMIAETQNMKNIYSSTNPRTLEKLTIRAQNRQIEVEDYNKEEQRRDGDSLDGHVKTRLELRSKIVTTTDNPEGKEWAKWERIIHNAVNQSVLDILTEGINDRLIDIYRAKWKPGRGKDFGDSYFIYEHLDDIYTRDQLVALCQLMGANNPDTKARDYKRRHEDIQLYDIGNVKTYADIICQAGRYFLDT